MYSENRNKVISLNLGIRTFMTGVTKNKAVKIGHECQMKIKEYLERKNNIMNKKDVPAEIKKKNEKICNKK
jgi:hypothetical protein